MITISEPFLQEVIHDNEQIFQRISNELKNAHSQVLVAAAWFTDSDLYNILLDLVYKGINVRIIIADNEDNKKLDFEKLQRKGAIFYRAKKNGYGGMHKKFCVIDKRLAIHGSYNWTVNARMSNQESVIVTTHAETVSSLVNQFNEMELIAQKVANEENKWSLKTLFQKKTDSSNDINEFQSDEKIIENKIVPTTDLAIKEESDSSTENSKFQKEYANVLDGMIAAEISNFDRELLRTQGFERAKANNGDAQILTSALDTVYSIFINDVNVVEDKKKRLIGKINEQKTLHNGMLENSYQIQLRSIATQTESTQQETLIKISNLKTAAGIYEVDINTIKTQKIIAAENEGKEIEANIHQIEYNSIVSKFKWYEFIPCLFLGIGLIIYLFLFYSSAVYILLYAEDNVKESLMNGTVFETPQVFDAHAFSNILEKGKYAIGFVFLFVFIPIAISMIGRLAKGSIIGKKLVVLFCALLVDFFIAYKVTSSIHEIQYITGIVKEPWNARMAFIEPNFYLVFVLGTLGLFILNALFNKILDLLEERNPDIKKRQQSLEKSIQKDVLDKNKTYIAILHESIETYNKELIKVRNEIHLLELENSNLPRKKSLFQEKVALEFENNKKILNNVTVIYISHIENDILPISLESMKDRISVFLEGWTRFLNDEYAVAKAIEKTSQAIEVASIWQQEKLAGTRINNHLKTLP